MSVIASGFYIGYMLTLYAIIIGFSVVSYILSGKSLSAIARRRGIEKPWLAWVPVGSDWMLGCISDQYRYVVHGQQRNARTRRMRRSIIFLSMITLLSFAAGVLMGLAVSGVSDDVMAVLAVVLILFCYAAIAVGAIYTVACHQAYFDLYRSCDPDKSLVYLLIGIFVSYPVPFFVYSCRNKDLGMPPRQQLPVEAE